VQFTKTIIYAEFTTFGKFNFHLNDGTGK